MKKKTKKMNNHSYLQYNNIGEGSWFPPHKTLESEWLFMYWHTINNGCYEFTKKFNYAPDVVYMNREVYDKIEHELYGEQWWHLVKHNSVRGLHVGLDENVKGFRIAGKDGDYLDLAVE